MQRNIEALKNNHFDVLIVGGGITGACLAHDATLRGLQVALVEKIDFCGRTSAASSKLIHCGIRYLPQGQLHKVIESAKERAIFQNIAPHLADYIPFLIPTLSKNIMKGRGIAHIGMQVFDLMTHRYGRLVKDGTKKIPSNVFVDRKAALKNAPELVAINGLNGAYTLFESHMTSSERTVLAFLKSAYQNGTVLANYVEVEKYVHQNGRVVGATVKDKLSSESFQIKAKLVVNAAGPFIPELNDDLHLNLHRKIRAYSKGVHLVTRQINPKYALALTSNHKIEKSLSRGGRHIFIIPWRGVSLIGTTDVPFDGNLDHVAPTKKDIDEFVAEINAVLPSVKLKPDDIRYAYAGLYPLISDAIKHDTYQGTGEYQIVDHARGDGIEGVMSVLGAKFTTARRVAARGTDLIEKKLKGRKSVCRTALEPLYDGRIGDLALFIKRHQKSHHRLLPPEVVAALIQSYGRSVEDVLMLAENATTDLKPLSSDRKTLPLQIRYSVTHEMAQTLTDVMLRRTGLGTIGHPGESVTRQVAKIMQKYLGWDDQHLENEIRDFNAVYHFQPDNQ